MQRDINHAIEDEWHRLYRKPGKDSLKKLFHAICMLITYGPGGILLYLLFRLHGIVTRTSKDLIPTPGAYEGFMALSMGATIGIYATLSVIGFLVWLI